MKTPSIFLTLSAIALLATSCSTECPPCPEAEVETIDMEAVKAEIGAMEAAYQTAANARDVEGVLAYYAEDAHSFAPEHPTREGKDAIRASMNEDPSDGNGSMALETLDIWAAGDIAVETGTYKDMDSTGAVVASGKYMSIFEKRDGKYICVRDIWNSDMPDDDDDEDDEQEM